MAETLSFKRRNLPHWYVADRPYFVTFRLKGSLPRAVETELRRQKQEMAALDPGAEAQEAAERVFFNTMDSALDLASHGPLYLKDPAIAKLVLDGFEWLTLKHGWTVYAASVMSNHVHAVVHNRNGGSDMLGKHLGVLKGFVAREANKVLDRTGHFWISECFDHWCRDARKTDQAIQYTLNNPVKAGLVKRAEDWPWTICCEWETTGRNACVTE
jgi:putative transposase